MKEFADIKNSIGLHVAQCMQAQILIRYKKFASIKNFIGLYVVHNQVQVHLNVACMHKYEEFTEHVQYACIVKFACHARLTVVYALLQLEWGQEKRT